MFISQLLFVSLLTCVQALETPRDLTCTISSVTFESILVTCKTQVLLPQSAFSVNFTSNDTSLNDTSSIELNCTSDSSNVQLSQVNIPRTTCLIKVNTAHLQPGYYDLKLIGSAVGNDSIVESDTIKLHFPKELQAPVCTNLNYDIPACIFGLKKMLCVSCVAPIAIGTASCSILYTSKYTTVQINSHEAKPYMLMEKDNVTTYSAECYHILDSRMFDNGIKFNINFTQDIKNGNTSVTSVSSASYYYESTKIVNFTVDENPIGVCANIGDNVTLSCVTQGSPLTLKFLQLGPSINNGYILYDYPNKDITWTMKKPSEYGYYSCFTGQQIENRKTKSVYVVPPDQTMKKDNQTYYKLQYSGINNDTAFVLIEVTGCPEPSTMTLFRKEDEFVKGSGIEILTEGVNVAYIRSTDIIKSSNQYKALGFINVTFLNKDLTLNLPEYRLNVSNGLSNFTIIDFGVYGERTNNFAPNVHSVSICWIVFVLFRLLTY
ncbi:hypothetical protein Bpfe_022283 [Biomphalaria pfeifferi]|uniref:Ig-like domain-containing protein n=1 Tax=Biomphalaria pfeifferi TaxID=112525 RepID=A0AAD8B5D1_BIOPF|nr:hypothetical protein Bpfe_022283 [Biomphalaria pfeifferi]